MKLSAWLLKRATNVSWRMALETAECSPRLPIQMIVLKNKELQLLNGKLIEQRAFIYLIGCHARQRSLVWRWEEMEEQCCENRDKLRRFSVDVDLHEESRLIVR